MEEKKRKPRRPRVVTSPPIQPRLFDLPDELRSRLVKQLEIPVTFETYPAAAELLDELGRYGKPLYDNGFGMVGRDLLLSDSLSQAVANYEVSLEKTQAQLRNLSNLTDQLVEEMTQAIKVTELRQFNLQDPAVADLEEMKEKLTKALELTDQLIALQQEPK